MTEELYNAIGFKCLHLWMSNREQGKNIGDYLLEKGIKKAGIYGYGILGRHLIDELQKSNIEILWIMDKNKNKTIDTIPFVNVETNKKIEHPEIVIVASIKYYEEIERMLISEGYMNVRGIEEIVEVLYSSQRGNLDNI